MYTVALYNNKGDIQQPYSCSHVAIDLIILDNGFVHIRKAYSRLHIIKNGVVHDLGPVYLQ